MKRLSGITIRDTDTFNKSIKTLKKKFRNIENDCDKFVNSIEYDEDLGIHLGQGVYKARIANSDKNSGKVAVIDCYHI